MKAGMVGLGKLGLPVAKAMSLKHEVFGYDVDATKGFVQGKNYFERGL